MDARPRLEGTPYVLERVLGTGAMGEVWLGEHASLRRAAVIKLIHPRYQAEAQVVARMRREARIVANLRHEALVTVYDLGETADGRTYIAMEWLDGSVLRQLLRDRGALPEAEAIDLAIQALDGLGAAHVAGVIHRDVKPENLFVTREGRLKVLDFGVAKPMQDGEVTGARTAAGMVLGTPRYMAPEQAIGRALSPATDVYALGCVLFELCVGRPVFEGTDARDLLYAHVHTKPDPMSTRTGRAFDPGLEAIVACALEKDPAARFASASAMASALRGLARAKPSAPPPGFATNAFGHATGEAPTATHAGAPITDEAATRPLTAARLLGGVVTTQEAPLAGDDAALDGASKTAKTEALDDAAIARPRPAHLTNDPLSASLLGPDDSALAITESGARARPWIWIVLGAGIGAAAAVVAVAIALHGRGRAADEDATKGAQASASTHATASASATDPAPATAASATSEPAKPEPIASGSPTPIGGHGATPPIASAPSTTTSTNAIAASATASTSAAPPAIATTAAPPSHYDLARQALADGDLDLAEREARLAGSGTAARLLLGDILERRGKSAMARDVYRKILEGDPDNAIAKTRLARLGG